MRGVILRALPATAALLALAGCGTSGPARPAASASTTPAAVTTPDVQTLLAQVAAVVGSARSVHVSEQLRVGAWQFSALNITRSGGISGTLGQGSRANRLTVLATGGKVYLKVTVGFVKVEKLPAATCSPLCGKWLLVSAATAKSFTASLSWSKIFTSVFTKIQRQKGLTVHGPVTVDGVQAWVIGKSGALGTMDVAAHGTPYVLHVAIPGLASIDFTDWNTATIPPPPPASDVIGLSQLSQLG